MAGMQTEAYALQGGLDLVTPALALAPGFLIAAVNYEPDINGGYRRMYGIERFDGRTRPSTADFYVMSCSITNSGIISVGTTIYGAAATAVILQINGTTELIVSKLTGTFVAAESLHITSPAGAQFGTLTLAAALNGASTPQLLASYKNLAADLYRADIQKPTGSGPIRGVWYYNGSVYAFRNNAGGTACDMWKSSSSGWTAVSLGTEIQFTAGAVVKPAEGETLTQGGVTATIRRVLTRTGAWGGTAVGTLVISGVSGGNFAAGAATASGGATLTLSGVQTAITLAAGGRYEFVNSNFTGSATTKRMYWVDGVNKLHEFDGTYVVPIRTGISTDNPKYLAAWQNMMVVAIASSVQTSTIGDPYAWSALTGAAELALGDLCTGLLPQLGNANGGALAIGTRRRLYVLYGTSSSDFNLVIQSPDAGAEDYSMQNIGYGYFLDTKGVVSMQSTLAFGNFILSTLSRRIQPLIDSQRGKLVASCIVRSTNQLRLFFNDGTGVLMYVPGVGGQIDPAMISFMPFNWENLSSVYMNTVVSQVADDGIERIFAGGSDGMAYELDVGTSHDGYSIFSHFFTAFNSNRSPRNRKHYQRATLQVTCKGTAGVNIGYDLSYGGQESDIGAQSAQTLLGQGSYWDIFNWDSFNWDTPYVTEYTIDTPGNGRNFGLVIYGDTDVDLPYTIHSTVLNYRIGRLER